MTAHHRAAIFHHAKKVKDTEDVDYVDWLQLFAPAALQQREITRRQAPTLRSTTPRGLPPGRPASQPEEGSVAQLIAQLKSLTPTEAAKYLESLNLSEQTSYEILSALHHEVPQASAPTPMQSNQSSGTSATGQPVSSMPATNAPVSPETGDKLIREVLNAPITPRQKMKVIKDLPISAQKRVEVLEMLGSEELAQLQAQEAAG